MPFFIDCDLSFRRESGINGIIAARRISADGKEMEELGEGGELRVAAVSYSDVDDIEGVKAYALDLLSNNYTLVLADNQRIRFFHYKDRP